MLSFRKDGPWVASYLGRDLSFLVLLYHFKVIYVCKVLYFITVFSAAVSVKMNILLFAPGLFIIMFSSQGMWKTALNLILCASVQVSLF